MRGILALSLCGLTACTSFDVPLFLVAPPDLVDSCLTAAPADTLVMEVYEYRDDRLEGRGAVATACGRCGVDSPEEPRADCRLIARQCVCGASLESMAELREAFREVRLEGTPVGVPVCVRLVAAPTGSGTAPRDCSAEPFCRSGRELQGEASLCMLSQLASIGEGSDLVELNDSACPRLDPSVEQCRDASCDCALEGRGMCLLEPLRDSCDDPCGREINRGCFRLAPACSLATIGTLTSAECLGF